MTDNLPYNLLGPSLLTTTLPIFVQNSAAPPPSGIGLWMPVISAALGAAVGALATPIIKDIFVQSWNERKKKIADQHAIYRMYAAPLVISCEKLVWRLSDVFVHNRFHFLKSASLPLVYNEYKRHSTLYRIASLLGWIRAMQVELDALPRGAVGSATPISDSLHRVQSILADGPDIELMRLDQLCDLWQLGKVPTEIRSKVAVRVELKLFELAGNELKNDPNSLRNAPDERKLAICRGVADCLCAALGRAYLSEDLVLETKARAIESMSYREALIYREWQDAIGDSMLEKDEKSTRRFKVAGYERFDEILNADKPWMKVLRQSIIDIDFESVDPSDYRATQLKSLGVAVSKLLIQISSTDQADLVNPKALEAATKLLQATTSQPSSTAK